MWRGSLVRATARTTKPLANAATVSLLTTQRGIFRREHISPITVRKDSLQYPASLSWSWQSDRPRHLVARIGPPLPTALSADVDKVLDEDAEGQKKKGDGAPDVLYFFGRLFLRPVNVAELLAVLQGWTAQPAVIKREHASLTLSATPPAPAKSKQDKKMRLSSFVINGTFTSKSPSDSDAAAGADSTDHMKSVYNLDDVRNMELRLTDSELMLLTVHLECVLRDCFRTEHSFHWKETSAALERQRTRLLRSWRRQAASTSGAASNARYRSQEPTAGTSAPLPHGRKQSTYAHQRAHSPPKSYYTAAPSNEDLTAPFDVADEVEAVLGAATRAVSGRTASRPSADAANASNRAAPVAVATAAEEGQEEGEFTVDDVAASAEDAAEPARSAGKRRSSTAVQEEEEEVFSDVRETRTKAPDAAADNEDEYEEIEEEVEVDEEEPSATDEEAQNAARASSAASAANEQDGSAAVSGEPSATLRTAAPAAAAAATSARKRTGGEVEMESESRYAKARFIREGDVQAAEVNEVGKAFGFDVVQNTKIASMKRTTAAGAQAVGTESLTTGTFRSEGGAVTGHFTVSEQSIETVAGASSAAPATGTTTDAAAASNGGESNAAEENAVEDTADDGDGDTEGSDEDPATAVETAGTTKRKAKGPRAKKGSRRKRKSKKSAKKGQKAEKIVENVTL